MNQQTVISFLLGVLTCAAASALLLPIGGCGETADATAPTLDVPPDMVQGKVPGVVYGAHLEPEGLHRYMRWSRKVGQGAQPEGEIAFQNIAALGYTTVLSVDGARPAVELAEKHGLRYVHIPIGYDGITKEQAAQIVKALRISKGPIFIHCHHGVHRGPAAAQLCRIAEDGISNLEGIAGLETSGTSVNYEGLWRDVRAFQVPSEKEIDAVSDDLPSIVMPKGMVAGMVEMSNRWTNLKIGKAAKWGVDPEHPDVSPPHEARMLWELFREMHRNDPEAEAYGEVFLAYLKESEKELIKLEKAIRSKDKIRADAAFAATKQLCKDCHRDYRN